MRANFSMRCRKVSGVKGGLQISCLSLGLCEVQKREDGLS